MIHERGRQKFSKYKKIIIGLSKIFSALPIKFRIILFTNSRRISGIYGIGIRYILLKSIAKGCGENVSIHSDVFILRPEKLVIGNNVSIHPMSYIDATGEIIIGNDVSIAHGVTIMSTTHIYSVPNIPIKDQGVECIPTRISDDVWVGAKATILGGNHISEGNVIAAGSVITKKFTERNVILGGVPARILKAR